MLLSIVFDDVADCPWGILPRIHDSNVDHYLFAELGWAVGGSSHQVRVRAWSRPHSDRYADNITKGFAASLSIVLSAVVSAILFDEYLTSSAFLLGGALTIGASLLYSKPDMFARRMREVERV